MSSKSAAMREAINAGKRVVEMGFYMDWESSRFSPRRLWLPARRKGPTMLDLEKLIADCESITPGSFTSGGEVTGPDEDHDWYFARGPMIKGKPYEEARALAVRDASVVNTALKHLPELARVVLRLRELLAGVEKVVVNACLGSMVGVVELDKEDVAELRELLDLPAEGK